MDFGSKFVYRYDHSDEECISDGEDEAGMNLSDSSSGEEEVAAPRAAKAGGLFGFFSRAGSGRSQQQQSSAPKPKFKARNKSHHWRNERKSVGASAGVNNVQGRRVRRADTNVVKIKFDTLTKPSDMHTGETQYCTNCTAVLSHLSKVIDRTDNEQIWACEFCSHSNIVDLMPEEIPKGEDVTFMLEPAPAVTSSQSGKDASLIVFCIDISGSMCVTTEVPGNVRLRGDRLDRLQSLNDERESQYLPGQRRNVTYVSRLQGVQAAIDKQLADMQKEFPERRVALVTFNNEVTVIGDGSTEELHLAKHKLGDKEELIKIGGEIALPQEIKSTRNTLGDKVFDLEEGGGTALGPALLLSVAMASQVPGSKVIICTDGMANVGIGSLDDPSQEEVATEFYTDVGNLATDKGVSVSVTTIKGADCKLVHLGSVADMTGGQVNIVDPLQLTSEFDNILADPVIAMGVVAKFITHTGLYIRNNSDENFESNCMEKLVGNVTADTEISFEFGIKTNKSDPKEPAKTTDSGDQPQPEAGSSKAEASSSSASAGTSEGAEAPIPDSQSKTEEKKGDEPKDLPFQLQITYTDMDGAKALRVITQSKPVTKERKEAEKHLNFGVLGTHVAHQAACLASEGHYTKARSCAMMQQRLMSRYRSEHADEDPEANDAYTSIFSRVKVLENKLNVQQKMEVKSRGRRWSDDEDDCDEIMEQTEGPSGSTRAKSPSRSGSKGKMSVTKLGRMKDCDDSLANTTYQLKKAKFSLKKK